MCSRKKILYFVATPFIYQILGPVDLRRIYRRSLASVYEEGDEFESWQHFLKWEFARRLSGTAGDKKIDAAIICTPDNTHHEVATGLAPLKLHLLCEKPLATTLGDCVDIYRLLRLNQGPPSVVFSVGHVMRYAPHNQPLRKSLREDNAIKDIVSIEHTENVGW